MSIKKVIITGAAGFIGSCLARQLNKLGYENLILVDKFGDLAKKSNVERLRYNQLVERELFHSWLNKNHSTIELIYHLGARTNTAEFDTRILDSLNLSYSKKVWEICTLHQIPLIYASSAATYGLGEHGFNDAHSIIPQLKPLNPYGESKQLFDLFVLEQKTAPPFWAGLKFFNVYGPHEAHKGRMASVAFHAFNQIKATGKVKLFKSDRPDYKDGEQKRDFIFIDDVTAVCLFFLTHRLHKGIYNVGTAQARTFNALADALFSALQLPPQVEYIPTPMDIRDKYQYFTEATMDKLRSIGFVQEFTSLEDGMKNYVEFLNR